MWCVDPPTQTVAETFSTCISRIRDVTLKARLAAAKPTIVSEENNYEIHADNGELHRVAQSASVNGNVTTDEMVGVYDQRMAGKKGPGRSVYTAIKLLPAHDRCPFCDHRDVTTLDHILPKRLYPGLAVTPLNLVGSCQDCNKSKSTAAPTTDEDSMLHPYFDDVSGRTWLTARVVEEEICAVLFGVRNIPQWSDSLNERLKNQFQMLRLGSLYSQQAAREMSGIRANLVRVFESEADGAGAVRRELMHQWCSRRADRRNSWQTSTYWALGRSDWFCEGGFRLGQR